MTRTALAALLLLAAAHAPAAELVTLTGKRTAGTLDAITPQAVTLRQEAGPVSVPANKVAAVEFRKVPTEPSADKQDEIELTDGSRVRASAVTIKGKVATVAGMPGPGGATAPKFELPLSSIAYLMRNSHEPANREAWQKLLANKPKRDLFVVRQADGLNPLPGTVLDGNETGDAIQFEREDGTKASLRLSRASGGLVFYHPAKDVVPPTVCRVFDSSGNVWLAQSVTTTPAGLSLVIVSGATITYATLDQLDRLDFRQGNVAYLSDLEGVIDYPPPETDGLLGEQFPLKLPVVKDRAFGGAEFAADGQRYAKGLSLPPDVVISYKLDGNYRDFKAVVTLPERPRDPTRALRLKIELDGRVVFDEVVKQSAKPKPLAINVKEAKVLKISVERESLYGGDQLQLLEARVQK